MYISIDMETMRFLHKHVNYKTVADLDYICGKGNSVSMGPCGEPAIFSHMTFLEKEKLFENTTGQKPSTSTPAFNSTLAALTEMLPITEANAFEADRQAAYLEQRTDAGKQPSGYKYVFGASTPGKGQELLFPAVAITPEECRKALLRYAAAAPPPAPVTMPAAPASPARRAANAPVQRPRSGVCQQIWELLDKEKAANDGECPTRDRIKQLATENGWNPSTVSVQSSAWRKANNFA